MHRNSRQFEQTQNVITVVLPAYKALHISADVMEQFFDQWTGHGHLQNWPLLSLDLNLLDFHVWDYIKNMVYECKVNRREELLHRIFYAKRCMNDPDVPHQPEFKISIVP
jgi:hypothetical protein